MEILVNAYVSVANKQVNTKQNSRSNSFPLPRELTNIKQLDNIAVTTSQLPVLPNGNYSSEIVSIQSFDSTFRLVGGVNVPKKANCKGSDGKSYPQLIKGNDDLRQDAVMEQVFEMVNNLLKQNPVTRKRSLRIRTYKVIPLSPNAGLLEWVENTLPLRMYLVDSPNGYVTFYSKY